MPEARPFKDARRWHMPISFRGTSISMKVSLPQSYMDILARSGGLKHALMIFPGSVMFGSKHPPVTLSASTGHYRGRDTDATYFSRSYWCAGTIRRTTFTFASLPRCLEPCQPGRIAPPTWAVAAASFTDEDRKLSEELRSIVAPSQGEGAVTTLLHNQSGLNGLATSGVEGLDSVSPSAVSILVHSAVPLIISSKTVCSDIWFPCTFYHVHHLCLVALPGAFSELWHCNHSPIRRTSTSCDLIWVLSRGCSELVVLRRVSSGFLQHSPSTT